MVSSVAVIEALMLSRRTGAVGKAEGGIALPIRRFAASDLHCPCGRVILGEHERILPSGGRIRMLYILEEALTDEGEVGFVADP